MASTYNLNSNTIKQPIKNAANCITKNKKKSCQYLQYKLQKLVSANRTTIVDGVVIVPKNLANRTTVTNDSNIVNELKDHSWYNQTNSESAELNKNKPNEKNKLVKFLEFVITLFFLPIIVSIWAIIFLIKKISATSSLKKCMTIIADNKEHLQEKNNKTLNTDDTNLPSSPKIIFYLSKGSPQVNLSCKVYENDDPKTGNKFVCRHFVESLLSGEMHPKDNTGNLEIFKNGSFINNFNPKILNKTTRYQEVDDGSCQIEQAASVKTIIRYMTNYMTFGDLQNFQEFAKKHRCIETANYINIYLDLFNNHKCDSNAKISDLQLNKDLLGKIQCETTKICNNELRFILGYIYAKHVKLEGFLINPESNSYFYACSKKNFPNLIGKLCQKVANKPANHQYKFYVSTLCHAMGLIISAKPCGTIKIKFYDPNFSQIFANAYLDSSEQAKNLHINNFISQCYFNKINTDTEAPYLQEELDDINCIILRHFPENFRETLILTADNMQYIYDVPVITKKYLINIANTYKELQYPIADNFFKLVNQYLKDYDDEYNFTQYPNYKALLASAFSKSSSTMLYDEMNNAINKFLFSCY